MIRSEELMRVHADGAFNGCKPGDTLWANPGARPVIVTDVEPSTIVRWGYPPPLMSVHPSEEKALEEWYGALRQGDVVWVATPSDGIVRDARVTGLHKSDVYVLSRDYSGGLVSPSGRWRLWLTEQEARSAIADQCVHCGAPSSYHQPPPFQCVCDPQNGCKCPGFEARGAYDWTERKVASRRLGSSRKHPMLTEAIRAFGNETPDQQTLSAIYREMAVQAMRCGVIARTMDTPMPEMEALRENGDIVVAVSDGSKVDHTVLAWMLEVWKEAAVLQAERSWAEWWMRKFGGSDVHVAAKDRLRADIDLKAADIVRRFVKCPA